MNAESIPQERRGVPCRTPCRRRQAPELHMAVLFDSENKVFTIHTENTTYQMKVDSLGSLLHLYYGRKTKGCMDYLLTYADRGFSGNPYDAGTDRTYSMDALPQELPSLGTGDYRNPALIIRNGDGSVSCDLRFKGYGIEEGKYGLEGLPAVYAESGDKAQTLRVYMEDQVTGVDAELLYGVLPEYDIITRSLVIANRGEKRIYVEKAAPACLDFLSGNYDIISFYGRHAMERNFQRIPAAHGSYTIGSRRGTSSHQYSPFFILADRKADEDSGSCYGLSFVYSGGFKGEVETDQYNQTRAVLGLQEEQLSYPLEKGERFVVPEVVMSFSAEGFSALSHNFHRCFRNNLCRGYYKNRVRPILVNSWEASYFDFDGDSLLALARQARELGIEMLVLDDGWFGDRNDDNRGLGDWTVNRDKLKYSMGELAEKINSLGLKFGLWIEPEMVSEDSRLYREHPDWALQIPGRKPVRSRNQLVLDFSRTEVADFIFEQICSVLDHANIEYVKWDMNRSLSDVYSVAGDQGKVLYDYMLGVYRFLERLIQRYPNLLIEGCSGGGGRYDAGMLYYTPQIWCSDNTDAVDRLKIQYGTSFGFPVSACGSHVSTVPNHQTGRVTSLKTRGITAMPGTFGYELDLGKLTDEEKEEVKEQIREYHRFAPLIQNGLYYRLRSPFEDEAAAWEFVSEDGSQVLIQAVTTQIHGNMTAIYVKLRGLETDSVYEDENRKRYGGGALMETGLPLPAGMGEYRAWQMYLRRVEER